MIKSRRILNICVKSAPSIAHGCARSYSGSSFNSGSSSDRAIEKAPPSGILGSNLQKAAAITGGISITYLFYDLTYRFLSLSPAISLKYGFFGGVLSTGILASCLYGIDRYSNTRPDKAFKQGAAIASHHVQLKEALGNIKIEGNPAKVYRSNAGYFNLLSLRTPTTELLFKVKGSKADATVFVSHSHSWIFHKATVHSCLADVQTHASGARSRLVLSSSSSKDADKHNDRFNGLLKDAEAFSARN